MAKKISGTTVERIFQIGSREEEVTEAGTPQHKSVEPSHRTAVATDPYERTVSFNCTIGESLRKRIRVQCANDGQLLKDFIVEAFNDLLEKRKKQQR